MIVAFTNSIKYNEEINNIVNIEAASFFCYNVDGIVVGQGADGFLIKLNKLTNFLPYYHKIKQEDYLRYHDDFYISYYFHINNISIHFLNPPNDIATYSLHSKINGLAEIKGKYNRDNLNQQSYNILTNLTKNGIL